MESSSAFLMPMARSILARAGMIRSRIGSRQAVFHRAFDVTPDPFRALEELIDLGITRVLTSGQRSGAPEGSALIRQLIERAAGRIEVLPGAGIGIDNVRDLVAATGCTQIHMTAFSERHETSTQANPQIRFGHPSSPSESTYEVTDSDFVRQMKRHCVPFDVRALREWQFRIACGQQCKNHVTR